MARTAKSRAWFFPTSPRSPYKLQGELRLLKTLEGKPWNHDTQVAFADLLSNYEGFEGNISQSDPGFSARDRATRAPRLLGLVHFPKRGSRGVLEFTEAGNEFLATSEEDLVFLYQRQIAKVQFPSPLHDSGGFEAMAIRPLPTMIKLLLELDSLGKEEVALFALTLIDYRQFDIRVQQIHDYRAQLKSCKTGRERKQFRNEFAKNWVAQVYSEDISRGDIILREGGSGIDAFVRTKRQSLRDYADATIRYLRATNLFTVEPHGQRFSLSKANIDDATYLADNIGLIPMAFPDLGYDRYVTEYLGNPSIPEIRKDDPTKQTEDLSRMLDVIAPIDFAEATAIRQQFTAAPSRNEKLKILNRVALRLSEVSAKEQATEIRKDFLESMRQIGDMYEGIVDRLSEVVDRPLMYEWNTWRALVLINDALEANGNFSTDTDGNPVTPAPGKRPDIVVEYKTFWLIVEVTLQSGYKQYEMEGESIVRHIGTVQRERLAAMDKRPVYGLFLAEKPNDEVIHYLHSQARYKSQVYSGPVRILPLPRQVFQKLMAACVQDPFFSHEKLKSFFDEAFTNAILQEGEIDRINLIFKKVEDLATAS